MDEPPIKVSRWERIIYEFIGSAVVIFVGLGSVAVLGDSISHAFAEGFVYWATLSLFFAFGAGHFNPAITLVKMVLVYFSSPNKENGKKGKKRRFRWYYVGFIIAQYIGAIIASLMVWALTGDRTFAGLGMPVLGGGFAVRNGVVSELIFSTFIIFVYCLTMIMLDSSEMNTEMSASRRANIIGMMILAFTLVAHPISGANFNPFRFLGPALIALDLGVNAHIYVWPPFVGSVIAGVAIGAMLKFRDMNVNGKYTGRKNDRSHSQILTTK